MFSQGWDGVQATTTPRGGEQRGVALPWWVGCCRQREEGCSTYLWPVHLRGQGQGRRWSGAHSGWVFGKPLENLSFPFGEPEFPIYKMEVTALLDGSQS